MRNVQSLRPAMNHFAPVAPACSALRHARRRTASMLFCLGLLATGCAKNTTGPALEGHLPPSVIGTFPAARATGVPFETAIWARFREPLDSTTVSVTTVFLKVDTRRIPVTITLEDSARKIVVRPFGPLELRRTHTIEFSPRIRTAAGVSLNETYFWQFTTISVRRPSRPEPASGATFESPVAPLFWDATEAGAGPVEYRLFHGADSAQVDAEATIPLLLADAVHLPASPWERGTTVFWRVRAHNVETGDEAVGPVWRFDVVPSGATLDSILISIRDAGYWDDQFRVWRCSGLASGVRYGGLVRFDATLLDSSLVVADANVVLFTNTMVTTLYAAKIFQLANDQAPCDARFQGFPKILSTPLAGGIRNAEGRVQFGSAILAAQIQARIRRHREFHDYSLRSQLNITYLPNEAGSGLRVYYLRPSAAAGKRR